MKMTKIWITIVMMAIMTVAFAGCGNSDDGSGSLEDGDAAVGTETTTVEFETVDLDGKTVSSRELFAENKVTMINFWGTFCGPCIREMPEIEEIYREYSGKGVGIIGALVDVTVDDDSLTGDAKAIVNETGVTYMNLLGWNGFDEFIPEGAVPTTWFVDGEGNVIGEYIVGADPQKYRKALDEYLADGQ